MPRVGGSRSTSTDSNMVNKGTSEVMMAILVAVVLWAAS